MCHMGGILIALIIASSARFDLTMPHSICTLIRAKCATSCGVVGPMHQRQSVCALCYWHTQTLLHYSLHCTRTAPQHKDPPTSTSPFGTSPTRGGNLLVTGNTHCGQGTKAKNTKGATRREGREERTGGEALAAACREIARMSHHIMLLHSGSVPKHVTCRPSVAGAHGLTQRSVVRASSQCGCLPVIRVLRTRCMPCGKGSVCVPCAVLMHA